MTEVLLTTALWTAAAMATLWLVSLALRDASIVDIWWGPGFVLIAAVAYLTVPDVGPRGTLLVIATALWGLRLGVYLFVRNAGHGEDPRYQAMRRHWGPRFAWVSAVTVFTLQGVLQWVVSLPAQVGIAAGSAAGELGALAYLGVAAFALGLGFEALGDIQLSRFRADPANAGQVMNRGLWRYTRHPNYFGDCVAHWGIFAIAWTGVASAFTLIGPALMTFLLLRVSGVAMLERSMHKRRPEYARYQAETNAFFPGRWRTQERPDRTRTNGDAS